MKEGIRRLIELAYPTGVYTERNDALLDRDVKKEEVDAFVEELRRLQAGDVRVILDTDYQVCWDITVKTPSAAYCHKKLKQVKGRKKPLEPGYATIVLLSRLGRYFYIYWNVYFYGGGGEFRPSPPPAVAELARWIFRRLEGAGFEHVSIEEAREVVPWVSPGDSICIEGPVRVYNCLFSEH